MLNSTYKVQDLQEFKPFLLSKKRIMGLDLGKKRIGVSVSTLSLNGGLPLKTISEDKLSSLSTDLGSILKFIDRLQSIETDNVDPTSNSLDQSLIMRDDIALDENSATEILENAPEKELDFFSVPKVIE